MKKLTTLAVALFVGIAANAAAVTWSLTSITDSKLQIMQHRTLRSQLLPPLVVVELFQSPTRVVLLQDLRRSVRIWCSSTMHLLPLPLTMPIPRQVAQLFQRVEVICPFHLEHLPLLLQQQVAGLPSQSRRVGC